MPLKRFLDLFDNWNMRCVINNNNLQMQYKANIYALVDKSKTDSKLMALMNCKVVSFGFYDNELTIKVDV